MSLDRARNLIELLQQMKTEIKVDKLTGLENLNELIRQNLGDEPVVYYFMQLKSKLNDYDKKHIPYEFYYSKKNDTLNFYVIH